MNNIVIGKLPVADKSLRRVACYNRTAVANVEHGPIRVVGTAVYKAR